MASTSSRRSHPAALVEPKEELLDLPAARIGESSVLADDSEPTFLEDADRPDIVFGGTCMDGASRIDVRQKLRERSRRQTSTPVVLAEPIGHFRMTIDEIAAYIPGDLSIHDDGAVDRGRGSEDPMPVRDEGFPVDAILRGERRHHLRIAIQFIAEEDREIVLDYVTQRKVSVHQNES